MTLFDELIKDTDRTLDSVSISLLNVVLVSFERSSLASSDISLHLHSRLPQLLGLDRFFPQSVALHKVILLAVNTGLPLGIDGLPLEIGFAETPSLSDVVQQSRSRWFRRSKALIEDIDTASLVFHDKWTDYAVQIITGLLYTSPAVRKVCSRHLSQETSVLRPNAHLAPIIYAFLDSAIRAQETFVEQGGEIWVQHFTNLTKSAFDAGQSSRHRYISAACVSILVHRYPVHRSVFLGIMQQELKALPLDIITADALIIVRKLLHAIPEDFQEHAALFVDHGLSWASRYFASDSTGGAEIIHNLCKYFLYNLGKRVSVNRNVLHSRPRSRGLNYQSPSCGSCCDRSDTGSLVRSDCR